MTYFTGIDLHKRTLTATTLDPAGTVVATAKRPCRPQALLAYFAQIPGEHAATANDARPAGTGARMRWVTASTYT